jgi:hypothetical protein
VHQDSMSLFSFFKLKEATGIDCLAGVEKGLQWLHGDNETDYQFAGNRRNLIFRGIRRRHVLQRMQNLCTFLLGNDRIFDLFFNGKRYFQTMEFEHSYHPGWILYALNKRNIGFWGTDRPDFA